MAYERRSFAGGAVATVLTSGINGTDTSIILDDATGWPTGSGGDFFIVLGRGTATEEKVRIASRSGTTLTVASSGRGADGTSAAVHAATSTTVEHVGTAIDFDEANEHVSDSRVTAHASGKISYDNSTSGLAATNVKSAIDEVAADIEALTVGNAMIASGSYTGDGGTKDVTLDFTPLFVVITNETDSVADSTADGSVFWFLSPLGSGVVDLALFRSGGVMEGRSVRDVTLGASKFTVTQNANTTGDTFRYVAFGAAA